MEEVLEKMEASTRTIPLLHYYPVRTDTEELWEEGNVMLGFDAEERLIQKLPDDFAKRSFGVRAIRIRIRPVRRGDRDAGHGARRRDDARAHVRRQRGRAIRREAGRRGGGLRSAVRTRHTVVRKSVVKEQILNLVKPDPLGEPASRTHSTPVVKQPGSP